MQYNSINYIDRDEAVEAIQKKAKRIKNLDIINGLCGAISILYELPVNHVKGKESEDKE
jgi:lantibiotic modifying enzyme